MKAPRTVKSWWRQLWLISVKAVRGATLLEDTPQRIARGCACGIFAAFLPVIGQTFVGMALSAVVRGNVIASVPWSWISNPFTTIPIWYGCYVLGAVILGQQPVSWEEVDHAAQAMLNASWTQFLDQGVKMLGNLASGIVLGTVLVGSVCGLVGYWIILSGVTRMQERRLERTRRWANVVQPRS